MGMCGEGNSCGELHVGFEHDYVRRLFTQHILHRFVCFSSADISKDRSESSKYAFIFH